LGQKFGWVSPCFFCCVIFTLIVRVAVSEILYFCDKAYVTMTHLSEVMPLLQKNRHKLNCVEYCWRQSVHSSSAVGLKPSGLEHSRCSCSGRLCVLYGVSLLTIITVEYKLRKYIGHYVSFLSNLNLLLVCMALEDSHFFVPECRECQVLWSYTWINTFYESKC
jgi:hypothetical protein